MIETGGANNIFQVFELRLLNLPRERPFNGFTDPFGYVDESCTEASAYCIPLVIEANVPQGVPFFDRQVIPGDCEIAPCQEYPVE